MRHIPNNYSKMYNMLMRDDVQTRPTSISHHIQGQLHHEHARFHAYYLAVTGKNVYTLAWKSICGTKHRM